MDLLELLEAMPGGLQFAVRDFALVTLAGQLSVSFPRQLVCAGGRISHRPHDSSGGTHE